MKIVSLVPSMTASMFKVGLGADLVACTSFCVEPPTIVRSAAVIGGTKNPDIDKILGLKPTHVFANKEENHKDDIDLLAKSV